MPTIRIEVGGQSFDAPLPATPVSIGSAEEADLRLQCEGVASQHCVLQPLPDGRHLLRDGNSGYGTLVNGVAVKQVSLSDGDIVTIGAAQVHYSLAGAVAAPAVAAPAVTATDAIPPAEPAPPAADKPAADKPAAERTAAAKGTPAGSGEGRASGGSKSRNGALLGIFVGLAALAVVVIAVGGLGSSTDEAGLQALYADGIAAYGRKDYERARELLEDVVRKANDTPIGIKARDSLTLLGRVETEMESRLDGLWAERLDMDAAALEKARASFVASFGESQAALFDARRDAIVSAQVAWKQEQLRQLADETKEHVAGARFGLARDAWRRFARGAPLAVDVTDEVDVALKQLIVDADMRADDLLTRSQGWIQAGQAFRSVKLLSDMLPKFKGLPAYERLSKALVVAEAARDKPIDYNPERPQGGDAPQPDQPTPVAPTTEEARKALEAQVAKIRAEAAVEGDRRRFQAAAQVVSEALRTLPAGDLQRTLVAEAADYVLAEKGLTRLIEEIHANPKRFGGIKLTERLTVSLVDADRDMVSARVKGGSSKWRWERLQPTAFKSLVARMKPGKDDAMAAAALLRAVGLRAEAEQALYAAGQAGVPTNQVFPVLARWRGEAVPDGGYVVHEERYVSPAQREHLIREAHIADALKRMNAREAADRKVAYEELLEIGEPASERFREALKSRRAYLAQEISKSKSFTSGKYKTKLLQLLDERRKHALSLIYNAQAYPYPNPQKKNQKEVEARVDQVREVWERPFDLVAQWDKKLQAALELVTEVDEYLARADPGYTPDLDEIKARINQAIDVPSAADGSKRPYSLKVLVYNTTLDCTATKQEKANVRSVNDYRMMMGLLAVKINERLLRAARGHSRHMQQNKYFAHDVPSAYATPQNRTPGARAKVQGFGGGVGENIARGPSTGHGAFMAWFRSSGHHRNMLGRGWLQLGCGRAGGSWWTQNFGGGSKSLKPPDPLPAPEPAFAPEPEDDGGRPIPPGEIEVPDEVPPGDIEVPEEDPEDDDPPADDPDDDPPADDPDDDPPADDPDDDPPADDPPADDPDDD